MTEKSNCKDIVHGLIECDCSGLDSHSVQVTEEPVFYDFLTTGNIPYSASIFIVIPSLTRIFKYRKQ